MPAKIEPPPLSLAQFQAHKTEATSSARGRLMAYMVMNEVGGQGAHKMLLDAPESEVHEAVSGALQRYQQKAKR